MISKEIIQDKFREIQGSICSALSAETGQEFREDNWDYESGEGGGITRIFTGDVIEKGGVNYSALNGKLSDKIASKLKGGDAREFYAAGVSLVIHPQNPFVPTVHMNIRYLERGGNQWFGGGIDLTPYYPYKPDIITFHKQLKAVCDKHDPAYYPEFKKKCDEYFFIKHRNEARGVGGIFFDYLSNDLEKTFQFVQDVGNVFNSLYIPFLSSYKKKTYSEKQKEFQQIRRGRYVEFNLVYDRGTLFGLETQGRIESILMSLPPQVRWNYNHQNMAESPEAELSKFLVPQDWANME